MIFSIKETKPNELVLTHDGWFAFASFGAGVLVVIALGLMLINRAGVSSCSGPLLFALAIYIIWSTRELTSVINKNLGTFYHKKSGVLGSRLDASEANYNLKNVQALEVRRYATRGADQFKLCLIINIGNGREAEVYISKGLGYEPAHQYAEQIQRFLGEDIPLKKVDGGWFAW